MLIIWGHVCQKIGQFQSLVRIFQCSFWSWKGHFRFLRDESGHSRVIFRSNIVIFDYSIFNFSFKEGITPFPTRISRVGFYWSAIRMACRTKNPDPRRLIKIFINHLSTLFVSLCCDVFFSWSTISVELKNTSHEWKVPLVFPHFIK